MCSIFNMFHPSTFAFYRLFQLLLMMMRRSNFRGGFKTSRHTHKTIGNRLEISFYNPKNLKPRQCIDACQWSNGESQQKTKEWNEEEKEKKLKFFFINKIQRFHLEIVGLEAIAGKNLIFLFLTSFFWTF